MKTLIEDIFFIIILLCISAIFISAGFWLIVLNFHWLSTVLGIMCIIMAITYGFIGVQIFIKDIMNNTGGKR